MKWRLILWAICIVRSFAVDWDASNFPNPTAGQFKECRMRTVAKICDPDGVLDDAGRNRLDYELQMLEQRTRQDQAQKFCDKKGVTAAMAIARRIKGGSVDAAKAMANDMLRRWTLDTQCQKAVVFVVSVEDQTFWTARDDKVPVYAQEFTQIFAQQRTQFKNQQYVEALKNILQGTWEKALSKQGSPRQPTGNVGGGGQRPSQGFGEGIGKGSGGSKGPEFKMPSIPSWFWLTLVFLVIPLLCCCLCLYCCCCRGKGSSGGGGGGGGGRQPVPQDYPAGMGGGGVPASGGGGGGGRGMFGNFMSTAGGAGIGSMIGNFLSNRNRGGGGGVPMGGMGGGGYGGGGGDYQGGGAYPAEPEPVYDDNNGQGGGGLYPSVPVKDEGGGGSWA